MISLDLNKKRLKYQYLPELNRHNGRNESMPYYIFDRYSEDFLERLYMLQGTIKACHALVLFEPRETGKVLRHINIIDGLTYTLIPTHIRREVYEEIYGFFMNSPLSVSYITWFAKLLLRPHSEIKDVSFNGCAMDYSACRQDCPLRNKSCTKGLLFTELFHPMKELPIEEDILAFCSIHNEFSQRIVEDYLDSLNSDFDMQKFDSIRSSFGVRNQYWIDPQRLFLGDPMPESKKNTEAHQSLEKARLAQR